MQKQQRFWRHPDLPQLELRQVRDGARQGYAPHTHAQWSLGAITGGSSHFSCGDQQWLTGSGTLVCINPHQVHACKPFSEEPWCYWMLYLDQDWLTHWCQAQGWFNQAAWQDFNQPVLRDSASFNTFITLAELLMNPVPSPAEKEQALHQALLQLIPALLGPQSHAIPDQPPASLQQLVHWLDQQDATDFSLEHLCRISGYSPGHLIRLFRRHYGLTPHAWLVDRRIQLGQRLLKQGHPQASVAQQAGFADQAHFQRVFKRLVAVTPGQYSQTT